MSVSSVIAIRYASMKTTRAQQFYRYAAYGQPDAPMTIDYFFWAIRDEGETILVDSGFSPQGGRRRSGREAILPAVDALRATGIEPSEVSRVIVTHFHYDHIGNLNAFPEARFTVQAKELAFWTGPHAPRPAVAASVEPAEIAFLQEANGAGRVDVVDGDAQVSAGVRVSLIDGHCPGQQIVTATADRAIVLCSDAAHFYEEFEQSMPHHGVFDLQAMYRSYDDLNQLATDGAVVIPGHDPAVMTRFTTLPDLDGLAVRLS